MPTAWVSRSRSARTSTCGRAIVDDQLGGERARQRAPGVDRLREQCADVDGLGAVGRAPPARRGVEVGEREPRAAQLELDGGDAPAARRVGDHAVEAEQGGAERTAQLVRGLGDEREPPRRGRAQAGSDAERGERGRPAGDSQRGGHAGSPIAAAVAPAASSPTSPSIRRYPTPRR